GVRIGHLIGDGESLRRALEPVIGVVDDRWHGPALQATTALSWCARSRLSSAPTIAPVFRSNLVTSAANCQHGAQPITGASKTLIKKVKRHCMGPKSGLPPTDQSSTVT